MPVIKNMMVRAGADFSSFVTQSKRASQSVKGLKTDVSSSFMGIKSAASGIKSVLGAIGVGVSVYSIVSSARDAAEAYDEQSEAETKLATAMRNSMSARNSEIQSVLNLCSAQQKLGVIGDELQLAGAQKLATYVSEINSLKELIPAMNDMTAQQYGYKASAENSASAAAALGKAMIGQTTALKRYGYTFTEDEAAIMNYGTEAERAATLAQVVERKVGGMNRSLAQTPTGRMQQLTNTLGDIRENAGACVRAIGTLFLPVLWKVADGLATITTWAQRAVNSVGTVFGYSKLVSGWEDATTSITDYGDEWDDTTDAIKEAGKAAEDTKGKLMGFDELNILNGDSAASAIADIVNAGNVGSTIPATSTAIPAVQDILGENRDIPWLTKLMLPVKDVLFDWHDLKPEQIAQKAVSGLGMLLGGAVGFMIGGVPGALVGTLAGLALTLVANSVIFDHDGVVSQSELMSMIVTGLNGLVGGAIGFAIGGVPGALIGATIGVGITLLAESIKPLLNVDGQEVMSGIVSGLTYGIGSAVGGLIGFTLGGPAGAVVGMLVGLGITFAITNTLAKHGNGSGGRGILSSIVDGLNMALAGGIGGIVGFAVGGPAGAAIGLLVGLGINFAITTSNAKHGSGRGEGGKLKWKRNAS